MEHRHHLVAGERHPSFRSVQAVSRYLYCLPSSVNKLLCMRKETGTAELTHSRHEETVGITGDDILQVVVLVAVDKLLHNDSRRNLGIVHVGKKHLGTVAPVNHKRRKHLHFLIKEYGTAAVDGTYYLTIDHGVLTQPQMGVGIYYLHACTLIIYIRTQQVF